MLQKVYRKNFPVHPQKFLMIFLDIVRFPGFKFPNMPSYFHPFLFHFPPILLNSPYIFKMFLCSYTKLSSPTKMLYFLPPKSKKPFVSPVKLQISTKMGMKKG